MDLAVFASGSEKASTALAELKQSYDFVAPQKADALIALGGDGFLLHCIHEYKDLGLPIYGMNRGTVGFLLNAYRAEGLKTAVQEAQKIKLAPIRIEVETRDGQTHSLLAFNEMSIVRYSNQSANLRIFIGGRKQVEKYVGDGLILATPAGSTAYNLAVRGPILPLDANVLALTPVSPFRPRRWFGAVVSNSTTLAIEVIDPDKRPVGVSGDFNEVREPARITARLDPAAAVTVLFDRHQSLDDRIVSEQFFGG